MMRAQQVEFHWLRNRRFDSAFLLLPLLCGCFFGALCTGMPALFSTVVFVDLWLLGYHHVISTYTRIAFDWATAKSHRFLVFVLPWLVLGFTLGARYQLGEWIIASVYLYWQWFHYTRQSYGVSRYYLAKAGKTAMPYARLHTAALYSLPITGILYRSWQAPGKFLFMDLKVIPVPYELVALAGAVSVVLILLQCVQFALLYRRKELPGSYALYMLTHYLIFSVGYILIEDINIGWLAVNMWHNMQYILFVWNQNNLRHRTGESAGPSLIARISRDGKMLQYFAVSLGITLMFYLPILSFSYIASSVTMISMSLIFFMAINFHHYVVDAVIWRRKKVVKV